MRNFQSQFDADRRRFNWFFRFVLTMVIIVFLAIIGVWITVGVVAFKAGDEISEKGLKHVIEQIWCGPNEKCL